MFFRKWAVWLDDRLRYADIKWWRLESSPLVRIGVRRQNFEAFLWPSLMATALWTGMPTMKGVQLLGLVVGLLCCLLLVQLNRRLSTVTGDLLAQLGVLLTLLLIVVVFGVDEAGTDHLIYRHLLVPVVAIVGVGLGISAIFARLIGRQLQVADCTYPLSLKCTELFQERGARLSSLRWFYEIWLIALSVLIRSLPLLWVIAVAVLLARPAYVMLTAILAGGAMGCIMLLTVIDDRLESSLQIVMQRLFRNTALGVSLVILALGAARLFGVSYVTTVFDSASGIDILIYFLAPYALAFWYDYWTDRLIGQQLFILLNPAAANTCSIPYPFAVPPQYAEDPPTSVPVDGRTIELHGQARFLVFRSASLVKDLRFQAWSYTDLFVQLAASGTPGGRALPLPQQIAQRVGIYRGSTFLITIALMCAGGWCLHLQVKNEELQARSNHAVKLSLGDLLDSSVFDAGRPAILIAASGGGTRAAVFTGAVLEGLDETRPNAIIVGSGVSGGAAALALYAGHRNVLQTGSEKEWNSYFDEITKPYIQDVIERAQEWRMVQHGRLGILLAESFDRYWNIPAGSNTFEKLGAFGLITNSTLSGRFDKSFIPNEKPHNMSIAEASTRYFGLTRSDVAGGRLVLTNLDLHGAFGDHNLFAGSGEKLPSLPILVDDKDTSIQRAAALSANFPPIFSNAAVDIDCNQRYWVTDGGAADNLGIESLLFALRDVVKSAPADRRLPAVIIVLVNASGIDDSYVQDRGVGSALGSGSHFAEQLDIELETELKAAYLQHNQENDLTFTTIAMPKMLRTSGSFGTHWMLQPSIRVSHTVAGGKLENQVFKGQQVVDALRVAYGARSRVEAGPLDAWIRDSTEFADWTKLRATLAYRKQH